MEAGCMSQETTGLKAALSIPWMYEFIQRAVGAGKARQIIADDYLKVRAGDHVIDVGCGTGEMIKSLPVGVRYVGFDLSEPYIRSARSQFGAQGRFECADVAYSRNLNLPAADVAYAIGLLHHLDDDQVVDLLRSLAEIIKPGGRVITVDPTLFDGQNRVAAFVAKRDRGRNVRSPSEYAVLARSVFPYAKHEVRNDLLRIPYSHCIVEMIGAELSAPA